MSLQFLTVIVENQEAFQAITEGEKLKQIREKLNEISNIS